MRHRFITVSYSREAMVELFGEDTVVRLERENCEPTGRVMGDGSDETEFTSYIHAFDLEGNECVITAYYYQPDEDLVDVEDLGSLDWEIDSYEIQMV